MIEILFYLTYDTILDMYNLVGFISHTALMSYHYDGHAILLVQLLQQLHHLHRCLRVESSSGLIGQDNLWTGDECSGYCHTLFLSSRQFVGVMFGPIGQAVLKEMRLKLWKIKPIILLRYSAALRSERFQMGVPASS